MTVSDGVSPLPNGGRGASSKYATEHIISRRKTVKLVGIGLYLDTKQLYDGANLSVRCKYICMLQCYRDVTCNYL